MKKEDIIQEILIENEGYLFNDFPLKNKKIDHILINNGGIFVITKKEYKKFLTGEANDEYFYEYNVKNKDKAIKYPNPVIEAEDLCFELSTLLEGVPTYIANLVVFLNDNCDLINSENVFNEEELDDVLNSFDAVYEDTEVFKIVEILQKYFEQHTN